MEKGEKGLVKREKAIAGDCPLEVPIAIGIRGVTGWNDEW